MSSSRPSRVRKPSAKLAAALAAKAPDSSESESEVAIVSESEFRQEKKKLSNNATKEVKSQSSLQDNSPTKSVVDMETFFGPFRSSPAKASSVKKNKLLIEMSSDSEEEKDDGITPPRKRPTNVHKKPDDIIVSPEKVSNPFLGSPKKRKATLTDSDGEDLAMASDLTPARGRSMKEMLHEDFLPIENGAFSSPPLTPSPKKSPKKARLNISPSKSLSFSDDNSTSSPDPDHREKTKKLDVFGRGIAVSQESNDDAEEDSDIPSPTTLFRGRKGISKGKSRSIPTVDVANSGTPRQGSKVLEIEDTLPEGSRKTGESDEWTEVNKGSISKGKENLDKEAMLDVLLKDPIVHGNYKNHPKFEYSADAVFGSPGYSIGLSTGDHRLGSAGPITGFSLDAFFESLNECTLQAIISFARFRQHDVYFNPSRCDPAALVLSESTMRTLMVRDSTRKVAVAVVLGRVTAEHLTVNTQSEFINKKTNLSCAQFAIEISVFNTEAQRFFDLILHVGRIADEVKYRNVTGPVGVSEWIISGKPANTDPQTINAAKNSFSSPPKKRGMFAKANSSSVRTEATTYPERIPVYDASDAQKLPLGMEDGFMFSSQHWSALDTLPRVETVNRDDVVAVGFSYTDTWTPTYGTASRFNAVFVIKLQSGSSG